MATLVNANVSPISPAHPLPAAATPVTVWVCQQCDLAGHYGSPQATGKAWLKVVHRLFATQKNVQVRPSPCLGGCEATAAPDRPNGCCAVGLAAPGCYSYVLNNFTPGVHEPALHRLVALYHAARHGKLRIGSVPANRHLVPHIATRLPPLAGASKVKE